MKFLMFFGTLLTDMAHFGKMCFVSIWNSFWKSLESFGTMLLCINVFLGAFLRSRSLLPGKLIQQNMECIEKLIRTDKMVK